MALRIIYGRAGTGKSKFCIRQIKNKIENSNKLVLIVPEQFTFQTENRMLEEIGEKYVLKAEVLSFKRLAYKVFNSCGGSDKSLISDAGTSMLIYKVLEELGKELATFATASKKQGFIDVLSKTITEFKKYNVDNSILENALKDIDDEDLHNKLKDLSVLFNCFNDKLHKGHIDGEDRLSLLNEKLNDCSIYDGAEIFIDEFTTFTPIQLEIITKLLKKAKNVNITLSMDNINSKALDSDLFTTTKSTERKLLKVLEENNIKFNGYVDLNKDIPYRFVNRKELQAIEKNIYAYPFERYDSDNERVRLYRANNSYDEMEFIAKDILRLVRDKGYRFKDISVVCRQIDAYEKISSVIFNEYEIPYYIDKKMDVASNPLIVLLNSAVDIITKNWNYESVFRYLKSGLVEIDTDDIDKLENYVLGNGIRGDRWKEESWEYLSNVIFGQDSISDDDKKRLLEINEIKNKVREPLNKFYKKTKGIKKLKEHAVALYEFLEEDIKVFDKIDSYVKYFEDNDIPKKAKEYSQVVDILIEVLEQIVDLLGNEDVELQEFMKILNVGLSKYEMGLIPVALDQVTIGDITRVKSKGAKALYIVGFNDGVLPSNNSEEGILSDLDRLTLKEKGIELASDTRTKIFEEQFLVYTALTIAEDYLVLTYPLADFEGKSLRPSIIIHKVRKILPKLKEESENFKLINNGDKYFKVSAPKPTFNELIKVVRDDFDNKSVEDYWRSVYAWFLNNNGKNKSDAIFKGLNYSNLTENISREKIKEIYSDGGNRLNLSVSRLEKYSECPFGYYVQYGLRARDRKIYELSAPDLGSFMHEILDEFTEEVKKRRIKWSDLNQEKCREIIEELVDKEIKNNEKSILNSSKRYKYFTDRFKRILTKSVTIISEHMKRSEFQVFKNEFSFGDYKDSNPIKLNLPSGEEVFLKGRIDRIDSLDLEGNTYLRIIDYKSGNKKFDLNKFYNGLQIQLLVYLDALIKNSKEIINKQAYPGAIFYFKLDDPIIKSDKKLKDDEISIEVLKELKMDGLLLKDIKIVKAMDNELESGEYSMIIPARMNKGEELGKQDSMITMKQFDILREYVNKKILEICDLMISGNIDIKPCKDKDMAVCEYCDYSHICQFDISLKDNKYNIIHNVNKKKLWNDMSEKTGIDLGGEEDGN